MGSNDYQEVYKQTTKRNEFIAESTKTFAFVVVLLIASIFATYLFGSALKVRAIDKSYLPVDSSYHPYDVKNVAFKEPYFSPENVSSWVLNAVEECFNLSYMKMREELASCVTQYFGDKDGKQFLDELHKVDIPEQVNQNTLITWFDKSAAPKLISEGVTNGRYEWELFISGDLVIESSTDTKRMNWDINILVRRVSVLGHAEPIRLVRLHPK